MGPIHTSMQSCNAMNQYNEVDCVSDITRQQHNIIMQSVKAVYQCIQSQDTASLRIEFDILVIIEYTNIPDGKKTDLR